MSPDDGTEYLSQQVKKHASGLYFDDTASTVSDRTTARNNSKRLVVTNMKSGFNLSVEVALQEL